MFHLKYRVKYKSLSPKQLFTNLYIILQTKMANIFRTTAQDDKLKHSTTILRHLAFLNCFGSDFIFEF